MTSKPRKVTPGVAEKRAAKLTAEERVKVLADALQDVISLERRMQIKGELRRGNHPPIYVVNVSVWTAREALETAGIRVRKTGRV